MNIWFYVIETAVFVMTYFSEASRNNQEVPYPSRRRSKKGSASTMWAY